MADKDKDNDEVEATIADEAVVIKYKTAGEIANRVLVEIIEKCVEGASVRDVCIWGDNLILEETSKVFKKEKEMKKGIAFPVCISANGCICHFSPITSEPDHVIAKDDVLKIDLGVHLDGFISMIAHTVVVGANPDNKVTDKKANCFLAAHYASQAALRLMRPGNDTYQITDMVMKVCKEFDCKPVEGMLSHQLQQFKLDGPKTIIQNPSESHRKEHEKATIEANEVYALDVLVSTGTGAARETTAKVSVFKKTEEVYPLKLRASRIFYTEVIQKHSIMPFNLRNFEDEKKAKMGVMECVNHKLIEPFQVLFEKTGETVVQYKFTVLVTATGPARITGLPFEEDLYVPNLSIKDPEILNLLKTSVNQRGILQPVKKKKKKPQKNANNAAGENCSMDIDQPSKSGVEKMEVDA
ncbi:proliferation-associated protein 2G4 [Aphis craccivora]|uniref:Proliferation-associated protein 2G4 n=1 Tax=Aphis craccivora TaxID=307492 RepID=A0A6G0YZU5_APHCR|nr:proliferation-associated protein 2G4 [Aphis craccivora]